MIEEVVVSKEAVEDLEEGRVFYERRQAGIGDYFWDSLLSDMESLSIFAGVHSKQHGLFRTKLKDHPPDSKALNIETMLAAELPVRAGEDEEFEPLSEKLKRIIRDKRNGTLAGMGLLKELEDLAEETISLIQDSSRPLSESIAEAAMERSPALEGDEAAEIARAILVKADEILFPGWTEENVGVDLFREFTILLAKQFPQAGLHGGSMDFVDRCIKLLCRTSYKGKSDV